MLEGIEINLIAVLLAAIASIVIGFVWYMPAVFGNTWMKEIGKTREELQGGASKAYVVMTIGSIITAYVLAIFISLAGATDAAAGLTVGLWAWIGFVAAISVSNVLFEGRSWRLFFINVGYSLISLLAMGAILASWM